ncbi:hypothetical protein M0R45_020402 [Rubus argutus]|uniref:Ubiquitin-like domain-containing protein n=1 Tax=Rubus argutus TaxID=59490 RepID=A0AAW1X9L5_RUBAR
MSANPPQDNSQPDAKERKIKPTVTLKVKSQDGSQTYFNIRKTARLYKLMDAFCTRNSQDPKTLAFLFDGRRIKQEQTPDELEMEDGDEIDAMLHQTGGSMVAKT